MFLLIESSLIGGLWFNHLCSLAVGSGVLNSTWSACCSFSLSGQPGSQRAEEGRAVWTHGGMGAAPKGGVGILLIVPLIHNSVSENVTRFSENEVTVRRKLGYRTWRWAVATLTQEFKPPALWNMPLFAYFPSPVSVCLSSDQQGRIKNARYIISFSSLSAAAVKSVFLAEEDTLSRLFRDKLKTVLSLVFREQRFPLVDLYHGRFPLFRKLLACCVMFYSQWNREPMMFKLRRNLWGTRSF